MQINLKSNPSVEYVAQGPGVQGMLEHIEVCGRTCYRSQVKGGDSAKTFVQGMVTSGHGAMLEHGTVYLMIPVANPKDEPHPLMYNQFSRGSRVFKGYQAFDCITTNYRVLVENDWLDLLEYWCEPTSHHSIRATVIFDTNIGITREFNRHRVNSMAESSTRYCNYTKDKFDGSISVVEPMWLRDRDAIIRMNTKNKNLTDYLLEAASPEGYSQWEDFDYWLFSLEVANWCYAKLIERGRKPQEAREVLPLATNSQLCHTAFIDDWQHFFSLRADDTPTNHPHPMALELANMWREEMKKHGLI